MNIRLSYHDLKMFQRIIESVPWLEGKKEEQEHPANVKAQVDRLCVLGFTRDDCFKALQVK